MRIIGYADVERENEELARARAEVVHELLLSRGIAPERFDAVSWRVHGPPFQEQYRPQYRKASVLAYNAKLGPDEWRHYFGQLQQLHDALKLGCAEDEVYNLTLRLLHRRMLPPKQRLEMNLESGDSVLQCGIDHPFDIHKRALLCALFSKERTLRDLWLQDDTLGILPLKRGVYDGRLGSIKAGITVEQLYALLGERAPRSYARDERGRRVLDFRYRGFGRDSWTYTLDAGSGTVTRVSLTTIT